MVYEKNDDSAMASDSPDAEIASTLFLDLLCDTDWWHHIASPGLNGLKLGLKRWMMSILYLASSAASTLFLDL